MAFETSLPRPVISWDTDVMWPSLKRAEGISAPRTLAAAEQNWLDYRVGPPAVNAGATFGQYNIESGFLFGAHQVLPQFRGVNVPMRLTDGAANDTYLEWRWPMWPVLNDPALLGSIVTPESQRCVWMQFGLTADAFTGDQTYGILFGSNFGQGIGAVTFPDLASGSTFRWFGLTGDGAGGIQYVSFDLNGVLLEAVPAATFNPAVWNLIDLIIIGAAPGRDATLEMKCNGATVAARTFGSAELPHPPADHWRQSVFTRSRNGAGFLYVSNWRLRAGPFTPDGVEIAS